jgi:hypothetical protein
MIVFENDGEIDPRLVMLIGVNVKESASAIGFFGTGLKYAVASLARWGEEIRIQSGVNEYSFASEETEIRGRKFGVLAMFSKYDKAPLGFTTELGKRWEPWMVYRELWCNAHDEPASKVFRTDVAPAAVVGKTRVIVDGPKIQEAHFNRNDFILAPDRNLLHKTKSVEIYEGAGTRIFYRGIAVQTPDKPSIFTYNITSHLYLTEDRTAGSWSTDPEIAKALTELQDAGMIDATLMAPEDRLESRLDYSYAHSPGETWTTRATQMAAVHPMQIPSSVRSKFVTATVACCPFCGRPL